MRHKTGPLDLITDADEAAERMIVTRLAARFPGCDLVGEEAASADTALLSCLAHIEFPVLNLQRIHGLVTFPSYHTVSALLLAYTARGTRFAFISFVVNALMLVSVLADAGFSTKRRQPLPDGPVRRSRNCRDDNPARAMGAALDAPAAGAQRAQRAQRAHSGS